MRPHHFPYHPSRQIRQALPKMSYQNEKEKKTKQSPTISRSPESQFPSFAARQRHMLGSPFACIGNRTNTITRHHPSLVCVKRRAQSHPYIATLGISRTPSHHQKHMSIDVWVASDCHSDPIMGLIHNEWNMDGAVQLRLLFRLIYVP